MESESLIVDHSAPQAETIDEAQEIINDLTPDDCGSTELDDGRVVMYEGFTDDCIADAMERVELPDTDPRHLAKYEDVFAEVLSDFRERANGDLIESGIIEGDNPIVYAVFSAPSMSLESSEADIPPEPNSTEPDPVALEQMA